MPKGAAALAASILCFVALMLRASALACFLVCLSLALLSDKASAFRRPLSCSDCSQSKPQPMACSKGSLYQHQSLGGATALLSLRSISACK